MKKLIVNADDFGISAGVNQGILQAHREGIVTSTSVMVNLPLAQEIVQAVTDFPELGVGVHLNLTYGKPLLPPARVPSLVNAEGSFRRPEICFGQVKPEEVIAEWRAQVALFQSWGLQPTHLDSHHHVHLWPELIPLVARLAKKLQVPVRAIDAQTRQFFTDCGVPTARHFIGDFYGKIAGVEHLLATLDKLGRGVTELMCHPAIVDEELIAHSGYVQPRQTELSTLVSPEVQQAISIQQIALTNYSAIEPIPDEFSCK